MASLRQRKQIFLFLLAVLLPAVVFCGFTIRMIYQERELLQKRTFDERTRIASLIGARLAGRLAELGRQAASRIASDPDAFRAVIPDSSSLSLIGKVEAGRIVFPWDLGSEAAAKQRLLVTGEFERLLRQAEDAEFRRGNLVAAAAAFRTASDAGRTRFEKSYAALNLGRVLEKAGRLGEANQVFEGLAASPPEDTDEYGIPFSLWAVEKLARRSDGEAFVSRLAAVAGTSKWPSAATLARLKQVIASAKAGISGPASLKKLADLEAATDRRRSTIELAAEHRRSFEKVLAESSEAPPEFRFLWHWSKRASRELLFAYSGDAAGSASYLWAFEAPALLGAVLAEPGIRGTFPGSCLFATGNPPESTSLGPSFPDLQLIFDRPGDPAWAHSSLPNPWFYILALGLAFGATAFAMSLLLHDVRRESRLASLRSQFVSSVSHELKTPLTSIRMFAESLAMGWAMDPAQRQGYLETIVSESERLGRLLDNVLDFSKIEQGTRRYWMEPTSLASVIEQAARAISFPLERQGFKLDIRLDPDIPPVMADKDALEQAVLNLLQNAMKYAGESRTIEIALRKDGACAAIGIIDHGLGVREEDQRRIFEKFVRIESPDISRIPGAGLGLTIVRHIAEAHRGRIEVESKLGEGSAFWLFLPLEDSHEHEADPGRRRRRVDSPRAPGRARP